MYYCLPDFFVSKYNTVLSKYSILFNKTLNLVRIQRDSPTRFLTSCFFHHFNQPGPLTNGLKYFRIWFRFRRDIRILIAKKLTRRNKKKFNLGTVLQKTKCSPLMVK